MSVCLCLQFRISQTTGPTWFSFSELDNGPANNNLANIYLKGGYLPDSPKKCIFDDKTKSEGAVIIICSEDLKIIAESIEHHLESPFPYFYFC